MRSRRDCLGRDGGSDGCGTAGIGSGEKLPCCKFGAVVGVVGVVSAGLVMKGSKGSLGVVFGAIEGCDSTPVASSMVSSGGVVKGSRLLLGEVEGQGDGSESEGVEVSSVGASAGLVKGSKLSLGSGLDAGV